MPHPGRIRRDRPTSNPRCIRAILIRYNGGGFVSQLIAARLARKLWALMQPRHGFVETYPSRVVHGPLVVLTNHAAGSDGLSTLASGIVLYLIGTFLRRGQWRGVDPRRMQREGGGGGGGGEEGGGSS